MPPAAILLGRGPRRAESGPGRFTGPGTFTGPGNGDGLSKGRRPERGLWAPGWCVPWRCSVPASASPLPALCLGPGGLQMPSSGRKQVPYRTRVCGLLLHPSPPNFCPGLLCLSSPTHLQEPLVSVSPQSLPSSPRRRMRPRGWARRLQPAVLSVLVVFSPILPRLLQAPLPFWGTSDHVSSSRC